MWLKRRTWTLNISLWGTQRVLICPQPQRSSLTSDSMYWQTRHALAIPGTTPPTPFQREKKVAWKAIDENCAWKKKYQRKWLKTNPKDSAPSSEGWDLKMPKSCSRPQWTQRGQLCFRFKRHFTEQSSATILNMHTGKVVWISAVRYNCDYVS